MQVQLELAKQFCHEQPKILEAFGFMVNLFNYSEQMNDESTAVAVQVKTSQNAIRDKKVRFVSFRYG